MDVACCRRSTLPSYDAELANAFKAAPTVVVLSEAAGASPTTMHVSLSRCARAEPDRRTRAAGRIRRDIESRDAQ
jgi:hypothetical protein